VAEQGSVAEVAPRLGNGGKLTYAASPDIHQH